MNPVRVFRRFRDLRQAPEQALDAVAGQSERAAHVVRLFRDVRARTTAYYDEEQLAQGLKRVEAFTEVEPFRGPPGLGKLEAFHTSGGSSTAPWTFRGKLRTYVYKTLRYPGHFDKMRAVIELGLLDLEPVDVRGRPVVPRDVFHAVAGPRLSEPGVRDVVLLRVDCTTTRGRGVRYQLVQRFDARTGFTAMEQTTGYPTAAVAHALALGQIRPGAVPPERAGLGADHVRELRRRGLKLIRRRI